MNAVLRFVAERLLMRRIRATKGVWASSIAALFAAASSSAFAADIAVKAPPMMAPVPVVYNWTGFYIGGNFGGAWETGTLTDSFFGRSFDRTRSGIIGGGQVGYNWQFASPWVIGVEAMFDGADIRSDTAAVSVFDTTFVPVGLPAVLQGSSKVDWITTVAARLGWAANNWLFYAKGGGGWVHETATLTELVPSIPASFSVSTSDTRGGWLVGAGIEYGITPNWTVRVEYDHLGLDNVTRTGFFVGDTVTLSRHFDMVTAGLNFKF